VAKKQTPIAEPQIYLTPELEERLQDRLSRIEGHIRGIKKMLAEHQDCDQILMQVGAVKAAINQVAIKLLEGHMETCVRECIERGAGQEALERLERSIAAVLKSS
jgi:DNA-binding FrmR family transcriptional regulator